MSLTTGENSRRAPRQRVLKSAKIFRMNGDHAVDVTVRDMSDTGARVVIKDQMALPNDLKFVLPSDGFMHVAKVVWRRGDLAGLHFLSERSQAPAQRLQNGSML